MAINTDLLRFVSVDELLGEDATELRIPDFQRPYSWTPRHASELFNDIKNAMPRRDAKELHTDRPYIMGTVILLKRPDDDHFEIVDGQQRIITLQLIRNIIAGRHLPSLEHGNTPMHKVSRELERLVARLHDDHDTFECFRSFLGSYAQVLRIVTDDDDEAFQFFDSQNFRGKALRPHDLLKAFHLREMHDSSSAELRAVVEQWETADEVELASLFERYLSRIHWWSRNLPARRFTSDDLDIFKGIGRQDNDLPGADYHRAAKSVLPALQEWANQDNGTDRSRNTRRTRHQLDTPVVAGRAFFDFTDFMLNEVNDLDNELFAESHDVSSADMQEFRTSTRFQYCRELYLAAALFYTNKYSDNDLEEQRWRLFRWAYAIRLSYERVAWRTVDNYALGRQTYSATEEPTNLFSSIRDNLNPRALDLENFVIPDEPRTSNAHDLRLFSMFNEVK